MRSMVCSHLLLISNQCPLRGLFSQLFFDCLLWLSSQLRNLYLLKMLWTSLNSVLMPLKHLPSLLLPTLLSGLNRWTGQMYVNVLGLVSTMLVLSSLSLARKYMTLVPSWQTSELMPPLGAFLSFVLQMIAHVINPDCTPAKTSSSSLTYWEAICARS